LLLELGLSLASFQLFRVNHFLLDSGCATLLVVGSLVCFGRLCRKTLVGYRRLLHEGFLLKIDQRVVFFLLLVGASRSCGFGEKVIFILIVAVERIFTFRHHHNLSFES